MTQTQLSDTELMQKVNGFISAMIDATDAERRQIQMLLIYFYIPELMVRLSRYGDS